MTENTTDTTTDTTTAPVPAYAIAYLREVDFGGEIIDYLQRIDATLAPYGGRFLVHGGDPDLIEGDWGVMPGDTPAIVIIAFPDLAAVRGWYASPGYQEILPLRTEHSRSLAAVLTGVPRGYQATDGLAAMLATSG